MTRVKAEIYINRLKNADDVHDFAGNIVERINFVGSLFGFGETYEESVENENVLLSCLEARCELISKEKNND